MSECVVRMEMPSCCHDCPFEADQWDYPICRVTGRSEGYRFDTRNNRMVDCPIICQLPEGHGDLVDAGAFKKNMDYVCDAGGWLEPVTSAVTEYVKKHIDAQTVIVPAEAERSET